MSSSCPGSCLTANEVGGRAVVHVIRYAEVRGQEVEVIRDRLVRAARRRRAAALLLDFSGVEYLTAEALGMLVRLHNRLRDAGRRLILTGFSTRLFEILEVTRLDTLLDVRQPDDLLGLLDSVRV